MAVNFEGTLSSKEIELVIAENDNEWTAMTVDEIWTRVWQDAAIASGFISAQGKTPDGKPVNARVRFLAMLVKRDGRWQLVATQSAALKKL
jgi:ketosteroid isomerase-like protein